MRVTVVTSFSEKGYREYGARFLETFDKLVSADIGLVVYAEHQFAHDYRMEVRPLFGIDLAVDFIDQFKDDPLASGREPTPVWKSKDREDGYSFRTDAVKFCRKVFAVADAARRHAGSGILVWLDADVVTHRYVPPEFFPDLLGDADVAYLGREGVHSECGFLAFRLPEALPLIERWEGFYRTGTFLRAREWHDSYLFDLARDCVRPEPIRCRNLTPGGRGHVWFQSPLGQHFDHLKGDRKAIGRSQEMLTGGVRR